MSAWQQQVCDDLRRRFADMFARRHELAAQRQTHADGAAEQIKRLDADIEQVCRDLYAAERRLRTTP
jgi:hypothetical protein